MIHACFRIIGERINYPVKGAGATDYPYKKNWIPILQCTQKLT